MKILAFETSCDDTAVGLVEEGTRVLAHVKHSQIQDHKPYGGVVPEIAARLHSEKWFSVMKKCLDQAGMDIHQVDALAVTQGPGLQTSLLTGTVGASFLSLFYQKPLFPVHHIHGHISSVLLERNFSDFHFPALCLTVSGGHTDFYFCKNFLEIHLLGHSIDDAAGEAFDKCAKMLGLGYPGGPIVSARAEKGDDKAFDFPRIMLDKGSLDFSFSGLKAAVYRVVEKAPCPFSDKFINDVCASFQVCVEDTFLRKIDRALEFYPSIQQLFFVGGVSANVQLRERIAQKCQEKGLGFLTTRNFLYSTDNAAMIAASAFLQYQKNPKNAQIQFLEADSRWRFEDFLQKINE